MRKELLKLSLDDQMFILTNWNARKAYYEWLEADNDLPFSLELSEEELSTQLVEDLKKLNEYCSNCGKEIKKTKYGNMDRCNIIFCDTCVDLLPDVKDNNKRSLLEVINWFFHPFAVTIAIVALINNFKERNMFLSMVFLILFVLNVTAFYFYLNNKQEIKRGRKELAYLATLCQHCEATEEKDNC